jgi:hypothetical protein
MLGEWVREMDKEINICTVESIFATGLTNIETVKHHGIKVKNGVVCNMENGSMIINMDPAIEASIIKVIPEGHTLIDDDFNASNGNTVRWPSANTLIEENDYTLAK